MSEIDFNKELLVNAIIGRGVYTPGTGSDLINTMNRAGLIRDPSNYRGTGPIVFVREALDALPIDQLLSIYTRE